MQWWRRECERPCGFANSHDCQCQRGRRQWRRGNKSCFDGLSGIQQYSNVTLQANAPAWWIPTLVGGTVLTATQNAGIYFDGFAQTGSSDIFNLGYGVNNVSGFAAVVRGGNWINGTSAGLGAANLAVGPGGRLSDVGFRAAAL